MGGIDVSRQGHRPRLASAAAGLNGFGFLGCSTLDFIDVYLRDVESKPEGREVGVRAANAKKSAASNIVGRRAIQTGGRDAT
jgi:hypothetical protein